MGTQLCMHLCVEIFITDDFGTGEVIIYSTPSTSAPTKSSSGFLPTIKAAFPRIRVKDRRWNNCLVASCSSLPWFLAMAAPMHLTCSTATLWKPPSVSRAVIHLIATNWRRVQHISVTHLHQLAGWREVMSCMFRVEQLSFEHAGSSGLKFHCIKLVESAITAAAARQTRPEQCFLVLSCFVVVSCVLVLSGAKSLCQKSIKKSSSLLLEQRA